jgi:hypothetical protein
MLKRTLMIAGLLTVTTAGVVSAAAVQPPAAPDPAVAGKPSQLTPQQTQFFETKVRPILADKCYKCHSVDSVKVKGGLFVDSREGIMKGGENGPVIVPGNAAKSRFILAITYKDADLQMPPKGEKLSDQQITDLTEWVNMGAPDPRTGGTVAAKLSGLTDKARAHWAYQPIKPQAIPVVKNTAWVKTPVDSFIMAKLEANGLTPNKAASKEVLMRRAYYDLIGLPPTPEELSEFLKDKAPNAFEKVVDHLLASPHYGERWGRFWLDSARYADTTGAERVRNEDYRYAYAWTYRDWVIKSFNSDKPYDEFLMEQLAADQLPGAKEHPERLAALGFLTVGKRFANNNDTIDERIDTIAKAMLGMTVSCARCHDHKFDPIPQMDYYSLHGVLTSIKEPEVKPALVPPAATADLAAFKKKMKVLEDGNREEYYKVVAERGAEFRKKAAAYVLAKSLRGNDSADLQLKIKVTEENKLDRGVQGALRLGGDIFGPMRWFEDFGESDWKDRVKDYFDEIKSGRRNIGNSIVREAFINTNPSTIHSMKDVADIYGRVFTGLQPKADAYIKACHDATTTQVTGYDRDLLQLLQIPVAVEPAPLINSEHLRKIIPTLGFRNNQGNRYFNFEKINELELLDPGSPPLAMAVVDANVHDDPVFIRGEAANHGPIAPRRFLEILSPKDRPLFKKGSGRVELARDIASKDNPMTPRVIINRIWMHHFGEGFVRTPDDLGVQSEAPSHQELIDYLAARFMEEGWSFKKMHKLIMMSSVYQQTADANAAYALKDPANRYLWRANLRRLDFEAVRDTILMFTGNLDASIGGRPVNLTDEPYAYRRSIYGYIDRGNLPELMQQFDFSDPDRPNSHRTSTIVPQQALFFMNSPMAVDVARRVTQRPEFLNAASDMGRVRALYLVLFQREPQGREVSLAAAFFNAHDPSKMKAVAAAAKKAPTAKKMKGSGKEGIQNEGELVERKPLTLWEEYAQALLFTNEIAYVN